MIESTGSLQLFDNSTFLLIVPFLFFFHRSVVCRDICFTAFSNLKLIAEVSRQRVFYE